MQQERRTDAHTSNHIERALEIDHAEGMVKERGFTSCTVGVPT